ncbi:MAG: hypothetical protein ACREV6_15155 [Clostridium sp.]|uniref:hypothetical protein n=1 Tax=Clostridium sp. TaxID=1506 RepID=UPI003D6D4B7F
MTTPDSTTWEDEYTIAACPRGTTPFHLSPYFVEVDLGSVTTFLSVNNLFIVS